MIRLLLKILVVFSSFHLFKNLRKRFEKIISEKEIRSHEVSKQEREFKEDMEEREEVSEATKLETSEIQAQVEERKEEVDIEPEISEIDPLEGKSIEIESEEGVEKKKKDERFLSPSTRGGRPRKTRPESTKKRLGKTKSYQPKVELVCWKEGFAWVIGAEISDNPENFQLSQNGKALQPESSHELRYRLVDMIGQLKFEWEDKDIEISLLSQEMNYFIFKTRKNWNELGRLVSRTTSGFYIIVVPKEWERNYNASGDAPIEPESVHISDYKAHFFHLDQTNTNVEFITPEVYVVK